MNITGWPSGKDDGLIVSPKKERSRTPKCLGRWWIQWFNKGPLFAVQAAFVQQEGIDLIRSFFCFKAKPPGTPALLRIGLPQYVACTLTFFSAGHGGCRHFPSKKSSDDHFVFFWKAGLAGPCWSRCSLLGPAPGFSICLRGGSAIRERLWRHGNTDWYWGALFWGRATLQLVGFP